MIFYVIFFKDALFAYFFETNISSNMVQWLLGCFSHIFHILTLVATTKFVFWETDVFKVKNCCLKVKFNDGNQKDIFLPSFDDLWDIVDMEIQPCLSICLFLFLFCFRLFFVTWPVTKFL